MILRIFLTLILLLSSTGGWAVPRFVPVETHEVGIGDWQEVPFGKMRVLSCSTGVQDLAMVVGGLQLHLNPDWRMKRPTLKALSDKLPSWVEVPLVFGSGQEPIYQEDIVFPLVYIRNPNEKAEFNLGAEGIFPACEGDKCVNFPVRMMLPLSADEADYTSVCAYLIEQQRHVPLPAEILGVHGRAWTEAEEVHIAFEGIKKSTIAFLQNLEQKPFQVLETQLEETGILMRVKTEPWKMGEIQEWILVSDRGIFKVPVKMEKGPVALPKGSISWKIWFLGWELFFLTPLFIWWGLSVKKKIKTWREVLLRFALFFPFVFVLKALLVKTMPIESTYYTVGMLSFVCLFPPQRLWSVLLLFLLWPYFPDFSELTMGLFVLWFFVMWIQIMLPFVFLYFAAEEVQKILMDLKKKSFFMFNFVFLLPTVILLGGSVWRYCEKNDYVNALNPEGLSVVCSPKECSSWQNVPETELIASESTLGQTLQKIYNRSVVVIWQSDNTRVILAPGISVKKAQRFMNDWKNYHAVGKP